MAVHECFIFLEFVSFRLCRAVYHSLMSTNPKRTAPITLAATVSSTVPSCI